MADDVTQERIRRALDGVLLPLARTLLRCGVSYAEFAELAKRSFVEAASTDYGVRNRPTNVARVAVMTGLSRKEVSRIRKIAQSEKKDPLSYKNIQADVLHYWYTTPAFLDRSGRPRPLPVSGRNVSFTRLVSEVSADVPARIVLRELERSGAVMYTNRRRLLPTRREFVPDSVNEKAIEGLQYGLRRLAETVCYNSQQVNLGRARFQRIVHSDQIPMSDVNVVQASLAAILAGFATKIDDYLTSFQPEKTVAKGDEQFKTHVGVGLYYFDNSM